jgi:hypothetical protein
MTFAVLTMVNRKYCIPACKFVDRKLAMGFVIQLLVCKFSRLLTVSVAQIAESCAYFAVWEEREVSISGCCSDWEQ